MINITELWDANSYNSKSTVFYRHTTQTGKMSICGFLFQFSEMTNSMVKATVCQSLMNVKNVGSVLPGLPPVRHIAPELLGLASSVKHIALKPSKLQKKTSTAISEGRFLKADNITMHTHWTKSCS